MKIDQAKPAEISVVADRRLMSAEALERLRHVLIQLFSQDLFHQVGIRDICNQAKVSPKTVYKYFGNKEQLLEACVEQDLQLLFDTTQEQTNAAVTIKQKMRAQIHAIFEFYGQRREVARMVFLNIPILYWLRSGSEAHAAHRRLGADVYRLGVEAGELRADLEPIVINELIAGGVNRVISRWLFDELQNPLIDYTDSCFDFVWSAISTGK